MVTLSAPTLTDNGEAGDSTDGLLSTGWDELGPGDILTYTATYILTSADVNAGQVVNTATANAATLLGAPVTDSDTATTPLNVVSTLSLAKVATLNDGGDGVVNAGDTISYAFTVTNTGNIVQTNVSVSDPLLNVADLPGRAQAYQMMAAAAAGADPMTTASTDAAPFDPAQVFEGAMLLYAPNASIMPRACCRATCRSLPPRFMPSGASSCSRAIPAIRAPATCSASTSIS